MAKRRGRKRGTGSVIAVRPLSGAGLGAIGKPGSFLGTVIPPLVGGAVAGGAALILEYAGKPTDTGEKPSDSVIALAENSEWVSLGAGALSAGVMYFLFGTPSALAALAAAGGVSGTLIGFKALVKSQSTATTDPATGPTVSPQASTPGPAGVGGYRYRRRSMRGMGAIVPQLQPPGMNGLGAIVLEPSATRGLGDPRGETVSLGNVNPAAFGTPGFSI